MIRLVLSLLLCAQLATAQEFTALARVDQARSTIETDGDALVIHLALSQPVPWRVYTLADPMRLVLDFGQLDWVGFDAGAVTRTGLTPDPRTGQGPDGWSRLVLPLAQPVKVTLAGMTVDEVSGSATLSVRAEPVDAAEFVATAREEGPRPTPTPQVAAPDGPLVVAIDPGHGGIDPGATRGGVIEAALMLQLAREVADALNRAGGVEAVLTRQDDSFVPLDARMTIARAAGADLLISLHADALEEDEARGASVYTLNPQAGDRAAQRMAERHGRADLVGGLDLSGQDDRVARVLMEMAQAETAPASDRFATALVTAMRNAGIRLNSRPRREGPLAVLNATDFPSVLVETGFLSSASDRAMLTSAEGRAAYARAITDAVLGWALEEELLDPLKRN